MQIAAQLAIEQTHGGEVPIWELDANWIPEMCAHALTTSQIQLQIEADQADGNEVAGERFFLSPLSPLLPWLIQWLTSQGSWVSKAAYVLLNSSVQLEWSILHWRHSDGGVALAHPRLHDKQCPQECTSYLCVLSPFASCLAQPLDLPAEAAEALASQVAQHAMRFCSTLASTSPVLW